MNNLWKFMMALAYIAVISYVGFEFLFASKGDESLSQYEVQPITSYLDQSVLQYMAVSASNVYTTSEELDLAVMTE